MCQTSWAVLDEVNGQTYQGSYDTGMSFQYSVEVGAGGSWVYLVSLVRAKDLLQLSETWYARASSASQLYSFTFWLVLYSESCVGYGSFYGSESTSPAPKPGPKKPPGSGLRAAGGGSRPRSPGAGVLGPGGPLKATLSDERVPNKGIGQALSVPLPFQSPKSSRGLSPASSLILTLSSTSGSWWIDGMGAQFFVSDVNGYTEDFSGTLCATGGGHQTSSVQCLKALPDGQYLLRVTGLLYGNGSISWEFCGEVGEAYEQLYFSVSRGSCTPLDLSAVIFNTTGQIMEAETQVMLSGVVELVGVSAEMLSESDGLVLRHALANEVSRGRFAGALSPDEILIYSPTAAASDQDVSSPPRPNRALSLLWSREKTNKVGFEIPISISQLHGLDEASLELHLQNYFSRV